VAHFAPRQAFADQEPIDIDYRVAETCPSSQQFSADVRSRTALASQPHGRDARRFVVTVRTESDGQFIGDVSVVNPDGSSSMPREVSDASCLEVVRTLALVTALAIDPQASTGPSTIGNDQSSPPGAAPQASDAFPGAPPLVTPAQTTPASRPVERQPWALPLQEPRADSARAVGWHWSGGVQGLALFHVAPVAAVGGGVFAQLAPSGRWIIWPDFRLAAAYATATSDWVVGPPASAGAKSWWILARAEACPGRFGTADGNLVLRFCGFLDSGAFTNSGVDLANSRTTTREWFAVGPALRLTLALGSRLFVDFEPGLTVPITRWRFTYKESSSGSDQGLERIRSVGETFSLSLGYGFR
jgi:hypothetical protein